MSSTTKANSSPDVDKFLPGPDLDALVAERVLGLKRAHCYGTMGGGSIGSTGEGHTWFICQWCGRRVEDGCTGPCPEYPFPRFSKDIAQAWRLDNLYLRWRFVETDDGLEISVQPSREIWESHYRGICPSYQDSETSVLVKWNEVKDKSAAYALGRCRAILGIFGKWEVTQ